MSHHSAPKAGIRCRTTAHRKQGSDVAPQRTESRDPMSRHSAPKAGIRCRATAHGKQGSDVAPQRTESSDHGARHPAVCEIRGIRLSRRRDRNEARDESSGCRTCRAPTMTLPFSAQIVTVLDGCDDGSAELAGRFGDDVHFVTINARNAGAARASGFAYARSSGDFDDSRTWYATTDPDSRVGPDWLLRT